SINWRGGSGGDSGGGKDDAASVVLEWLGLEDVQWPALLALFVAFGACLMQVQSDAYGAFGVAGGARVRARPGTAWAVHRGGGSVNDLAAPDDEGEGDLEAPLLPPPSVSVSHASTARDASGFPQPPRTGSGLPQMPTAPVDLECEVGADLVEAGEYVFEGIDVECHQSYVVRVEEEGE
ncbi:hypothetical protein FOA52_006968, partial [Chlamydomonas sp. UWO 241]